MWYRLAVSNTSSDRASSRSRRPWAANAPAATASAAFTAPSAIQPERSSGMARLYAAVIGSPSRARSARDRQSARRCAEHLGLGGVERGDEIGTEDVAERVARDAVQRRALDVGARVLGVLVGDHDRVLLVRQREQPADRRLDATEVPAVLERGAVDRAAPAVVGGEDAAAGVDLGADHPARGIVGIDLLFRIEPADALDLGPQQRADLAAAGLDRRALGEVDIAAVLTARVELLAVGLDHRAAMRHAIGGEPPGEDRGPHRVKPRVVQRDGWLVWCGVGLARHNRLVRRDAGFVHRA